MRVEQTIQTLLRGALCLGLACWLSGAAHADGQSGQRQSETGALPASALDAVKVKYAAGRVDVRCEPMALDLVLRSLANEVGFELQLNRVVSEVTGAKIQATPVERALELLLGDIPYRVDYRVPENGGKKVLARVAILGEPPSVASEPPGWQPEAQTSPGAKMPPATASVPAARPESPQPAMDEGDLDLELMEQLESSDPAQRAEAASLLEPEGPFLDALSDLLENDPDPEVRRAVVGNLDGEESPEAIALLVGALDDPDRDVVLGAIEALEFSDDPNLVPHLAPLRFHPDERVRAAALDAIDFLEM
jgi:hypothetical protein